MESILYCYVLDLALRIRRRGVPICLDELINLKLFISSKKKL
jgi:hypothetical protein